MGVQARAERECIEEGHDEVSELVRAAANGAERDWEQLVERYSGVIWAIARAHRLSHEDAGDVVQTTWMRLAENIDELRNPSAVRAWLITTARRESLRVLRSQSRERPCGEELLPAGPVTTNPTEQRVLLRERDATLWRAFIKLSSRDQALLRLLIVDPHLSYQEIGSVMGLSIGSIGPTRARALRRLRVHIEQMHLGPAS